MTICIGTNCYKKVEKDDVVYFIKSSVFKQEAVSADLPSRKLTLLSDFVFDVVTKCNGAVHELIKRR